MIHILVWCDECGDYHSHAFTVKFNEPVNGEVDDESYWLPHWGVNPFLANEGAFNPEWN